MSIASGSQIHETGNDNRLMSTGLIIGLVLIGLFSFSALMGLMGYADDIRDKNNGQAHAISNSAIGFVGLKVLLDETGQNTSLDPNEASHFSGDSLRLYTLTSAFQTDALDELNPESTKLIILPKWNVAPVPKVAGWVRKAPFGEIVSQETLASNLEDFAGDVTLSQADNKDETIAKSYRLALAETGATYTNRFPRLQTIKGSQLDAVLTTESGDILLAKLKGSQSYILSDPDLLNTSGLNTRSGARFALDILNYISERHQTDHYVFDLSLHGIGGRQNMIKVFTQPPFLGITFLIIVMLILIAWQAFLRFGDAKRGAAEDFGEDFHMGPQSLTRTTADFLAIARREASLGDHYANLIRQQALKALHLPGSEAVARQEALNKREDKKSLQPTFSELKKQAQSVTTRHDMLKLADALQDWKRKIIS
ncbi:hypothetical protein [Litorimonas haliclonae]|uniref:hypothetical protein n=1 Tax=Litorimonas haliclonae TaxID=2081977 RepID=UPI0039EF386D